MYYHSKGLKTAETIKKGTMSGNIIPDFVNDYVKIKWCDSQSIHEVQNLILD
jgi:hypothetical protein